MQERRHLPPTRVSQRALKFAYHIILLYVVVLQKVTARSKKTDAYKNVKSVSVRGSDVHILLISSALHYDSYLAAHKNTMFHNFHVTTVSEKDIYRIAFYAVHNQVKRLLPVVKLRR